MIECDAAIFARSPCSYGLFSRAPVASHLEKSGMPLRDSVGVN